MNTTMYCIMLQSSVKKANGVRGKICTQAGHAYLSSAVKSMEEYPEVYISYMSGNTRKITLIVDSLEELLVIQEAYSGVCSTHLVEDHGLTVFSEPTVTCLGLGPIELDKVNDDLKSLKLFL